MNAIVINCIMLDSFLLRVMLGKVQNLEPLFAPCILIKLCLVPILQNSLQGCVVDIGRD